MMNKVSLQNGDGRGLYRLTARGWEWWYGGDQRWVLREADGPPIENLADAWRVAIHMTLRVLRGY